MSAASSNTTWTAGRSPRRDRPSPRTCTEYSFQMQAMARSQGLAGAYKPARGNNDPLPNQFEDRSTINS
jgi:hypothetical protein